MTTTAKKLVTQHDIETFLDRFDTFLFDCDGVLWLGITLLPKVAEVLDMLRQRGKKIIFVTNNSSKSRQAYLKKFQELGLKADIEEIFGSAYAAAVYLRRVLDFPKEKKVYVIGRSGICEELEAESVRYESSEADNEPVDWENNTLDIEPDPEIGAVLVGFDSTINYRKLAKAFVNLNENPGCLFLATNDDVTFPHHGRVLPGAGSIVSSIRASIGYDPKVLGKPHQTMLDCITAKFSLDRSRTCMVGDRLNTDIQFGINGGMSTLLVLTGITSEKELMQPDQTITPEYYAENLGVLAGTNPPNA